MAKTQSVALDPNSSVDAQPSVAKMGTEVSGRLDVEGRSLAITPKQFIPRNVGIEIVGDEFRTKFKYLKKARI